MVRMLALHEVRVIFGLCGDTSLPLYDALATDSRGIRHVLTRDERHAAYAADAYARLTGAVGVCEGPSGGGATHILPGIVEADESSIPVLALTTDIATTSAGRFALTELDQEALFRPLTKSAHTIRSAATLPRQVRAAFRTMTTGRTGAAQLGLPFDVQRAPVPESEIWADPRFGRYPALRTGPEAADTEALLEALLAAERPVIIVGGGITLAGAEGELSRFAEALDLPVCTSVSGQGALAETHPNLVGVVGSNGGVPATRAAVANADLVLFIGCRAGSVTTERWRVPDETVSVLHIDSDPRVLGANYPARAVLCADARLALGALNRLLADSGETRGFGGAALAQAAWEAKRKAFLPLARDDRAPLRPERVIEALNTLLPADAVLVADPGTPCPYLSAHFRLPRAGRHLITNRAHGALGYALGASVGAQIARPDMRVVAVMGDGSFGFAAGELETLQRLRLPVTLLVLSNASYGWIRAGQKHGFGGRYFSVDFSRTDHAAVAAAYGMQSWSVAVSAALRPALESALAVTDGPTLVDIHTQPLEEAAAPVSEWIA